MKPLRYDEGFSYIEILIVLAIMLILGGSIGFNAVKLIDKARKISAETQISMFRVALSNYYYDCSSYPSEYQGLIALWEKPYIEPIPPSWDGPYLDKTPGADPWGNEYYYSQDNIFGLPYVIISYGADGKPGGENKNADINTWE